jgi:hypothetical protein
MDFLGAFNWADEDAIVVDDNGVRWMSFAPTATAPTGHTRP